MRRRIVLVFMIFLTFSFFSEEQYALRGLKPDSSRVALVIGNSEYNSTISRLDYAESDAKDVAKALGNLGFKLIFVPNATREMLFEKIREWEAQIQSARVAIFYYVGHGMQVDGVNYLIPVDANIGAQNETKFEGVDASMVLVKLKDAGCKTNIVVLDACRNNPFTGFSALDTGFAEVKVPDNCIMVYSTRPGAPAEDENSFSKFFCSHLINESHLEIKDFLQSVTNHVSANTGGKQVPLPMGALNSDFYFQEDRIRKFPGDPKQGQKLDDGPVIFVTSPYTYTRTFVKGLIMKWGFLERSWHPIKYFKNQFEEIERKKIPLIIDKKSNLMWYQSGSKPMTHKEAREFVEVLNKEEFAGVSGWRLPTIEEAASLLDDSGDRKNDILYVAGIFSSNQKRIWTCDKAYKEGEGNFDEFSELYWIVDFKYGIVAKVGSESSISVRPVRSRY